MSKRGPVPPHFFRQSAVIPYRPSAGGVEILMITSRKSKRWVIPKGVVDPGLDAATSAAKEALEEAGIEGTVAPEALGTFSYEKWGGTCEVEVFAMEVETVHDEWLESFRRREWLTVDEAASRCREEALGEIVRRWGNEL